MYVICMASSLAGVFILKVLLTVHMSTLTYFFFLNNFYRCVANWLYVSFIMNSHEFEQFGSLHMCAPKKYIGRSGTRTR